MWSNTPTPINYGRIIMLIIIIGGFVAGLVLLRNMLNKNCSSGEVYDNKLGCIKDCSSIPNTHFSTETRDCVSNCLSNEKDCGGVCYSSDRNQQCLQDGNGNSYVCQINQSLCGGNCMNNDLSQSCVGGVIYDSSQVCDVNNPDKPVICDNVLTQCDTVQKVCVNCEKGRVLCKGVCCPENNFCNSDGTCVACDPKTTTVCGKNCCALGSLCSSKCIVCSTSLCNDICLDANQVCTNDGPCDPLNVYTQGGVNRCCQELACNGVCCGTNQSCQSGKCMDVCGSSFCDPDTQACFSEKDKDPYCYNKGCEWDEIVYNPQSIPYGTKGQQLEVCGVLTNGVTAYWSTKQQNATRTAKDVQASDSKAQCDDNDCKRRSAEIGLNKVDFDPVSKTCNSMFDCNTLLPDALPTCPLDNTRSCCVDASGAFTGQVCPGGNICIDGVCGPFNGYYCHEDGKCVQGSNTSFKYDPQLFKDENSCISKCIPKSTYVNGMYTDTVGTNYGISCEFGGNAHKAYDACNSRASSKQDLNTNYNWTCNPELDGKGWQGIKSDSSCNIWCDCGGTAVDASIYKLQ